MLPLNNSMKKTAQKIFYAFIALALPVIAKAQTVTLPDPLGLDKSDPVAALATRIINALLGVAGVAALLSFIYGGILWMTAGINPDNIKKGKTVMIWAVFGLLVIFASYALVNFIFSVLTAK